MIKLNLQIKE